MDHGAAFIPLKISVLAIVGSLPSPVKQGNQLKAGGKLPTVVWMNHTQHANKISITNARVSEVEGAAGAVAQPYPMTG